MVLSLFIFRRDLRLPDNTALINAMQNSDKVLPLFILTPQQVSTKNKFKSDNAIQFMMESLIDLDKQIKEHHSRLTIMYGDEIKIISSLHKKFKFDKIYFNKDYSPYSIQRDHKIEKWGKVNKIDVESFHDSLLVDTTMDTKTLNGSYYKIFTQFYNKSIKIKVRKPQRISKFNFLKTPYTIDKLKFKYSINDKIAVHGGRNNAKKIINNLGKFKSYHKTHDIPSISTTMLSAHNKFGTVSIREVYFKIKPVSHDLLKQLYWRDFYYYVTFHFPHLYKYQNIREHNIKMWSNSKSLFNKWANGLTGFPIVDAAIRQLNETGYMHNRCRMITAMFLSKDLLIDWKFGERYFTQHLVDVDRAQNLGNWNWCSSFGLDNASFLRIFNPWTQSEKFDKDAIYIKKWIKELRDVPPEHIHKWFKYYEEYPDINYPKPIILSRYPKKEIY